VTNWHIYTHSKMRIIERGEMIKKNHKIDEGEWKDGREVGLNLSPRYRRKSRR